MIPENTTDSGAVSSSKIERQVEDTRAHVSQTLDELRERISPGHLVDEALEYARNAGAGDFARSVGRNVRQNPVPFLLIGLGIGWLIVSRGSGSRGGITRERWPSPSPYATTAGSEGTETSGVLQAASRASDSLSDAKESAKESISGVKGRMSGAASSAREKASTVTHRLSSASSNVTAKASQLAQEARRRALEASDYAQQSWTRTVEEQPLVLIGIGAMAGALLGVLIPPSQMENRLMGSRADQLKNQAKDAAIGQVQQARVVARDTFRNVRDDMSQRGSSASSGAQSAVDKAAEKLDKAAEKLKSATQQSTQATKPVSH